MLIDWFTVVAQALNFLILVWLLKRFLYKPILQAIDAREQRIAGQLRESEVQKAEARKERDVFQQKNTEFDQQRATRLRQATDEARDERQRLLDEARQAAAALNAKQQETLRNEEHFLHQEIGLRTRKEVFAIARQVLTDLAGTKLEEPMIDIFIRRLRGLDGEQKTDLAEILRAAPAPALVRSAFDLSAEYREVIQKGLNETFSIDIPVRFETIPDLICGIELTANGQKVAWSIADYLTSLEKGVAELEKEQ